MPCNAVTRKDDGKLGEISVPCLFVGMKDGGQSWSTVKSSPIANHISPTKVVIVLVQGWYIINDEAPRFFLIGDTFDMGSGTTAFRGPWQ